jgi:hypothetical protein
VSTTDSCFFHWNCWSVAKKEKKLKHEGEHVIALRRKKLFPCVCVLVPGFWSLTGHVLSFPLNEMTHNSLVSFEKKFVTKDI